MYIIRSICEMTIKRNINTFITVKKMHQELGQELDDGISITHDARAWRLGVRVATYGWGGCTVVVDTYSGSWLSNIAPTLQ